MRDYEDSIRGYRIVGDPPKPDKRFNYDYLRPKTSMYAELNKAAVDEGAKCLNDDRFISDELPTDREAQMMCAGCPLIDFCRQTAEVEHHPWGVMGGKVWGRALKEAMGDD